MALDPGTAGRKRKRPKSLRAPVMGENAKDKARVGVQTQARETFERMQRAQAPASDLAAAASKLTPAEKKDLSGYARQSSRRFQNDLFKDTVKDTGSMLDSLVGLAVGVKPSEAVWSYTHPKDRLTGKGLAADPQSGPALAMFPGGRQAGALGKAVSRPAGADEIMESLPKAKKLRREQEKLYTAERQKRAAKFEEALQQGGEEGWRAAMAELKGELPKLRLGDDLRDFDQGSAQELFQHIADHEALRPFEKAATRRALERLLNGTVPARSEIKLLERTFGADMATQIAESASYWKKASDMGLSVINVPRAMMATLDISAPFRQGLVLGARHPALFAKSWDDMLKSFTSENAYMDVMDEIASRPTFKRMEQAKLQLTDFENLATREEGFQSNLAETLTGGKRSPVRMSGRAYSAFLNKFRADAFDNYLRMADEAGYDLDDPHLLRSIGSWINHSTGRGSIKSMEGAMVPLSALLFSPRLIASRLQLLNPVYYAQLHPFARKQALAGARNLLGAISLTLYMAKLAGAGVNMDPRNSDFGKIKLGDTRIDIAGGFQQYIVNATRIIRGETVSSTTGEVTGLDGGFGKPSRWSIAGNFVENKLAPVPRFGMDWGKNENFSGDEFDLKREGSRLFMPIGAVSTYEAYQNGGLGPAAATAGLGGIGFGVLNYESADKKKSGGSSLRSSGGKRKKSLRSGGSGRSKSLRRP